MPAYPLRRKDREISLAECEEILRTSEFCVLATVDAQNCPYAVPLSYVYHGGKIYFHSARQGHKIDNIRFHSPCSAAFVGKTQPVYAKNFTTYYESVVVFGNALEVTKREEKIRVLYELARKYLPDHMDKAEQDITASLSRTAVFAIHIEKMTGKAKRKKCREISGETL